ncbi:hypothetical protein ACQY0O_003694 [Thecaphora frezii]
MPPPPHPPHPPRLCLVAAFSELVAFPSAQLCPVFLGKVRGLFRVRTTKSTLWPTAFPFSAWMMTPHLSLTSTSSASPSSPTLSIPPSSPPPTTRTTKSPSALKMRLSTTSRLSTKTTRRTTRPASRWRSRSTFLPRTGRRRTTSLPAFPSARRLPCPFTSSSTMPLSPPPPASGRSMTWNHPATRPTLATTTTSSSFRRPTSVTAAILSLWMATLFRLSNRWRNPSRFLRSRSKESLSACSTMRGSASPSTSTSTSTSTLATQRNNAFGAMTRTRRSRHRRGLACLRRCPLPSASAPTRRKTRAA